MAYKIRAAFQPDPAVLENTLEILTAEYDTKAQALAFIKDNLEVRELTEDLSQVTLVVDGKAYIYFEVVTDVF